MKFDQAIKILDDFASQSWMDISRITIPDKMGLYNAIKMAIDALRDAKDRFDPDLDIYDMVSINRYNLCMTRITEDVNDEHPDCGPDCPLHAMQKKGQSCSEAVWDDPERAADILKAAGHWEKERMWP